MTAIFSSFFLLLGLMLGAVLAWALRLRRALQIVRGQLAMGNAEGERKLAELRDANASLQVQHGRVRLQATETHRELAALSYSISHDLRAPLRSVAGFSQALTEDYGQSLPPTAHDYLRRVRANAQHMSELIEQLLALSRIARAVCRPERVDLSALAQDVAAELGASDPTRRVEWDLQPDIIATGDRVLLGTAMRHLLGNAWKFTSPRAVAHIAFRALPAPTPAGGTVYQVRDDGVGFDMQYAGKLFGAFQRMHPPEDFAGHGIGLATVQRIIRQHGGNIQAESTPEKGAVFSFTLDGTTTPPATDLPTRLSPAINPADDMPSTLRRRTTAV